MKKSIQVLTNPKTYRSLLALLLISVMLFAMVPQIKVEAAPQVVQDDHVQVPIYIGTGSVYSDFLTIYVMRDPQTNTPIYCTRKGSALPTSSFALQQSTVNANASLFYKLNYLATTSSPGFTIPYTSPNTNLDNDGNVFSYDYAGMTANDNFIVNQLAAWMVLGEMGYNTAGSTLYGGVYNGENLYEAYVNNSIDTFTQTEYNNAMAAAEGLPFSVRVYAQSRAVAKRNASRILYAARLRAEAALALSGSYTLPSIVCTASLTNQSAWSYDTANSVYRATIQANVTNGGTWALNTPVNCSASPASGSSGAIITITATWDQMHAGSSISIRAVAPAASQTGYPRQLGFFTSNGQSFVGMDFPQPVVDATNASAAWAPWDIIQPLYKRDANTNAALAGAYLRVWSDAALTTVAYEGYTDASGSLLLEHIADGTFYWREISPPPGYAADTTLRTFSIAGGVFVGGSMTLYDFRLNIEIEKRDSVTNGPVAGATIGVYTDAACTALYASGVTDSAGHFTLSDVPDGTYYYRETVAPANYNLNPNIFSFTVSSGVVSGLSVIYDAPYPDVTIRKYDAADPTVGVAGATFGVYTDAACTALYGTYVTDANGQIYLTDVSDGTYYWREEIAPAGYILDSTVYSFVVAGGSVSGSTSMSNTRMPNVIITKRGSDTMAGVPGATISVYTDATCTTLYGTYVTDSNGEIFLASVPDATYYWRETIAPANYNLDNTIYSFTVSAGLVSGTTSFINIRMTDITLTKTDELGAFIEGTEFTLYRDAALTDVVASGITDAAGEVTFQNVADGTYYWVETAAAPGFLPDSTVHEITVVDGVVSGILTMRNIETRVIIWKQDAATENLLVGARFIIYDINNVQVAEGTTGADGSVTFTRLPIGTYHFVEAEAPDTYLINPDTFTFTLNPDGSISGTTLVANNRQPIELTIHKTKETGVWNPNTQQYDIAIVPAEGIVFSIYAGAQIVDSEGNVIYNVDDLVETIPTDINGIARTTADLYYGSYYAIETGATPDVILDATRYDLVLTQPDQTSNPIVFDFNAGNPVLNHSINAYMQIYKVAGDTTLPLEGVSFEVYDASGTLVDSLISDSTGHATTKLLPYGNYTLIETETVTGYALADKQDFSIYLAPTAGVPATQELMVVNNKIQAYMQIYKVAGDTSLPLEGVRFEVYDASGTLVDSLVTDSTGHATTKLLTYGNYTLIETETVTGYAIADKQDFSIYLSPTAGVPATQQMTAVNNRKAIIEVFKVSEDWQAPLSGVTFGVYTDAGVLLQMMVTNELGIASCTLPEGDYYLQEIATLTGYILDPTKYDVDADWAGVYKYSLSNQMTQLVVEKRSTTGQTLEGMGFTITNASGAIVPIEWNATIGAYVVVHVLGANASETAAVPNTVAHTGKNGTATILGLLPGSYIITEVEAPKGYLLDSVPVTVTVSAEVGAAAQIGTLINTPKITKTGETGSFWTPENILGVCFIAAATGMIALVIISHKKREEKK